MLTKLLAAPTWLRYGAASLVALASDMALFLLLLQAGIASVPASAGGYGLGIIVHWLISTRCVFEGGMHRRGFDRVRQKSLFIATALGGLALTMLVVGLGNGFGLDPRLAKLIAIVVSFQLTYALRRILVFRA